MQANARFRQLVGEGWQGRRAPDILCSTDDALRSALDALLTRARAFEGCEAALKGRSVVAFGTPVCDENGWQTGALVLLQDTAVPHASTALLQLQESAEAAEARMRNAALAQASPLALLEAAAGAMGETLGAANVHVFVETEWGAPGREADSDAAPTRVLVRCAAWPAAAPGPLELPSDLLPAVPEDAAFAARSSESSPLVLSGPAHAALREETGASHLLLVPYAAEARGAFLIATDRALGAAERAAAGRLVGFCRVLQSWTEAENRLSRTLADLEDALFTCTFVPSGQRAYAFVSPQVTAITGLDAAAILGGAADWSQAVLPEDRPAFEAHEAALRLGEPSRVAVRIRRPDGQVRWISERATPGIDTAGRPLAGGLLADVTAQKEAEAVLEQARRVAERTAQTRMAFLRTMSHELRTPLGAIRGFAEMLGEEVRALSDVPPVVKEFAGTIYDASDRALRLVTHLMDLSHLETGALELQRSPVDVAALAARVGARYADDLAARGIAYVFEGPAEPALALADPARLEQVFEHLLSNAAKFTEAGCVRVTVVTGPDDVAVAVSDTGCGIAPAFMDALFEPFAQEDARINRSHGGSGLGLGLAHRLVRAQGGRLEAVSAVGEGSTFTVRLPR